MIRSYDLHCSDGTAEHSSLATCLATGRQLGVPATWEHSWRGWEIVVMLTFCLSDWSSVLPPDDNSVWGCSDRLVWVPWCTAVLEHWSTAPSGPAHTGSGATVDRPLAPPSDRTAGAPADTGWTEPGGTHSAGGKYCDEKKTTERLRDKPGLADRPLWAPMCSLACWLSDNLRGPGE